MAGLLDILYGSPEPYPSSVFNPPVPTPTERDDPVTRYRMGVVERPFFLDPLNYLLPGKVGGGMAPQFEAKLPLLARLRLSKVLQDAAHEHPGVSSLVTETSVATPYFENSLQETYRQGLMSRLLVNPKQMTQGLSGPDAPATILHHELDHVAQNYLLERFPSTAKLLGFGEKDVPQEVMKYPKGSLYRTLFNKNMKEYNAYTAQFAKYISENYGIPRASLRRLGPDVLHNVIVRAERYAPRDQEYAIKRLLENFGWQEWK